MVEAEIIPTTRTLLLKGTIITYGNAANEQLSRQMAEEIETLWNEPRARASVDRVSYTVIFNIGFQWKPDLTLHEVISNLNPAFNFFRIENFAIGNISFVDGIGSNTGYFLTENLYLGSTTAAHEFGHGLGLEHPNNLDIRGEGRPGIMYPRGTWVDPDFQYDPSAEPGAAGGTMHPKHRRVREEDIVDLRLQRLRFRNRRAVLGGFTNVYHQDHLEITGVE